VVVTSHQYVRITRAHDIHSHSLSYGNRGLGTGKGPRKPEGLSYEVSIELVEGTHDNGTHFIVYREAAALATAGKGALDDDLIAILHRDAADHFQGPSIVLEQELKRRPSLLVCDLLQTADLTHDDHFLPIVMLGMRDHLREFEQFGEGGDGQQRDESKNHPKRGKKQGSEGRLN